MKPLEEFWTKNPLSDDILALSDPGLRFDRDRERVNGLVLNAVIKYVALYLEILPQDIGVIRDRVKAILERKVRAQFEMDPKEGMQFDACRGGIAPGNDRFGVYCAADVRRTSALFKEIAFAGRFMDNGRFVGLELGSGTGILMVAMAVAATRRGIEDLYCVGIEKSGMAAKRSQKALDLVLGRDHAAVFCKDIQSEGVLPSLFRKPIHYWVSETISLNTPKLDLRRKDFGLTEDQQKLRWLESEGDPYVEALRVSMKELPLFKSYVQRGATAMFPNVFSGDYRPDCGRSTIELKTSARPRHVILERTAEEFEAYEDFGLQDKRWESPEEIERMIMSSDV